ncbi:MAG: molybdenum cofactor guanylyltransferase [Bacteroidales bacterium]
MSSTLYTLHSTTLAILAGGKATRLGGVSKALIKIDGETIISRIHRALSPLCNEVIIISNHPETNYGIAAKVYPDIIQNCGPLGGIHSALQNSTNKMVLIVSSDMPFVSSEVAQKLMDKLTKNQPKTDIVVPTVGKLREPLFAIYSKKLAKKIASILADRDGHPTSALLNSCNTEYLDIEPTPKNIKSFTNINTFKDIEAFGLALSGRK